MTDQMLSYLLPPLVAGAFTVIGVLLKAFWVSRDRSNRAKRDLAQAQDEVGFVEKWWATKAAVGSADQEAREVADNALAAAYRLARDSADAARLRRDPISFKEAMSRTFLVPRQHVVGWLLTVGVYWPVLLCDLIGLFVIGQLTFKDGGLSLVNVLTAVAMIGFLIVLPLWALRRGLIALDGWLGSRAVSDHSDQSDQSALHILEQTTNETVQAVGLQLPSPLPPEPQGGDKPHQSRTWSGGDSIARPGTEMQHDNLRQRS